MPPPRNRPSSRSVPPTRSADASAPVAIPVSVVITIIAVRSWKIRTPKTRSLKAPLGFCSSKVRAITMVELMATIAAAKTQVSGGQPSADAAVYPSHAVRLISTSAVGPARPATWTSRRALNSTPRQNIRRMTPSSDSVVTMATSANSGTEVWGPTARPARRYPRITGCRTRRQATAAKEAIPRTSARLRRKSCGVIGGYPLTAVRPALLARVPPYAIEISMPMDTINSDSRLRPQRRSICLPSSRER